jgi:hypothetical protein
MGTFSLISKANFSVLRSTQVFDASVVNAQRERARKENPEWFNDPPGIPKPSTSDKTVMDFKNIRFDSTLSKEEFRFTRK